MTQVELERWHSGRIVLLGDACQAVSLFAGHGASMAMAAAWVLADELTAPSGPADEVTTPGDPAAAFARYQARMAPVIAEVQAFGRRAVRWMAPPNRWRILTRDLFLRLAALPGGERLFVNALSPGGHTLISARSDVLESVRQD
ncbi:hypothetical protein ACU635_49440 [[Actinomadura] parvosata]|uniref:hypothetical protein n=1 Tax=[Actinomadura] parvosata TaxID=1955412 RepID=UPI00406CDDDF